MTAQIAEKLHYQGEDVAMCTNPLSDYFAMGGVRTCCGLINSYILIGVKLPLSKGTTDAGNFTDYRFHRQELSAIYFGPMINSENRLSLRIAAGPFPEAILWGVEIGMSREFNFRRTDT